VNKGRTLGLIPARRGSKGIPHKNMVDLGGHPLIEWTMVVAKQCGDLDRIVVSSDDVEVLELARRQQLLPLKRPSSLASDEATTDSVIRHCLDEFPSYDYLVLLQPTSPFRTSEQVTAALTNLRSSNFEAVISVAASKEHPELLVRIEDNDQIRRVVATQVAERRQEFVPAYRINGAVYALKVKSFLSHGSISALRAAALIMDEVTSTDIDTVNELEACRVMVTRRFIEFPAQ